MKEETNKYNFNFQCNISNIISASINVDIFIDRSWHVTHNKIWIDLSIDRKKSSCPMRILYKYKLPENAIIRNGDCPLFHYRR